MILEYKKVNEVRLCVDLENLFQLQSLILNSCLNGRNSRQLDEATYLTNMDLNKGFHQVPLKDADIFKIISFFTPLGKFKFIHMPFELGMLQLRFSK